MVIIVAEDKVKEAIECIEGASAGDKVYVIGKVVSEEGVKLQRLETWKL